MIRMNFRTTIPDKEVWRNGVAPFRGHRIVGFKLRGTVGGEISSESIGSRMKLLDYCGVFHVKMFAKQATVKIIWDSNIPNGNITILSDSQAVMRVLASNVMNSKTVWRFRKHLNMVEKRHNVHIVWVLGQNDSEGNCRVDELARCGATNELSSEFLSIGVPLRTCKLMIDDEITDSSNSRSAASDKAGVKRMPGCRNFKAAWSVRLLNS